MTDKYAVIGNPIAHSKSPLIHAAFAKQTGQDISYEAVLAPINSFAATVKNLIAQGYQGVNVTVPFKLEAYALCDNLSERAFAAGAVNSLSFENNKINGDTLINGDNTDGAGLINDISRNLGITLQPQGLSPQNIPAEAGYSCLKGARILLLGAGGAAQGVPALRLLIEA
jgi:shikimate dehydrogenase